MGVEEVRQIKMPQHFARSLVPAETGSWIYQRAVVDLPTMTGSLA
jgi:hypothetical protein